MENGSKCVERLGVGPQYLVEMIADLNVDGPIGADYIRLIAEKVIDEVVEDMAETTDGQDWNADDLRLAFGRVLVKRLGIEI